jgi:hypothetical protein
VADDPGDLLLGTGRRIDVRATQPGGKQLPAAEHVEWQVAVTVVRIIGGVQVEDDLLRRLGMRVEKQVDEQPGVASPS